MYQNAADSGGRGWSEWSLQRRPFQCVLGQASRAFSSMSIVAPNCCQRAVLHKGSICMPPSILMIDTPADSRASLPIWDELMKIVDNGSGMGAALRRERERLLKPLVQERNGDRKSTRLNSSHVSISYAVFC